MPWVEWLGYIAGALVTFSLIPQIVRVFKLKSAREISMPFTVIMLIGVLIWLAYGILLRLPPLILWNTIGGSLVALLLYAKLRYGRER